MIFQTEATLDNLAAIRDFVETQSLAAGIAEDDIHGIVIAVDEAATNIIRHGYAGQQGMIEVEVGQQAGSLVIALRDRAPVFDPTAMPAPDTTLPLDQRKYGGMGIHIMRRAMDEVRHRALPGGGNELTLIKRM